MIDFIHCHTHSSLGSMADSMVTIDQLFKAASEMGQKAIALTEHGTMASVLDAHKASKKYGVKYIPGIEAYFVDSAKEDKQKRKHLILLAKNEKGYKNLLKLNYEGFVNWKYVAVLNKVFPQIDMSLLRQYHDGLICLTACSSGPLAAEMFKMDENNCWNEEVCYSNLVNLVTQFHEIFGEDLYLEVQTHDLKKYKKDKKTGEIEKDSNGESIIVVDQTYVNRKLLELSKDMNIKLVGTCDVHYLKKEDAKIHDMLIAINDKKPLSDPARHRYEVEEFYMKSGDEVFDYFASLFNKQIASEICANTIEVANKCEDSEYIEPKETRFPKFDVKAESDYEKFLTWKSKQKFNGDVPEDHAYLRYKCVEEFGKKFSNLPADKKKEYKQRILDEIKILEMHNFSSYILIVADFIRKARKNNIRVGPGRGCLSGEEYVLTNKGFKSLKDIIVGDYVYTKDGDIQKVNKTFVYDINEEVLELSTQHSLDTVTLTKDHLVFGVQRPQLSCKNGKKYDKISNNPEWIEAQDLSVGDVLFTAIPKRQIMSLEPIDTYNYFGENQNISIDGEYVVEKVNEDNQFSIRKMAKITEISRNGIKSIKTNKKEKNIKTFNNIKKIENYLAQFDVSLEQWKKMENTRDKITKRFINFDEDFAYFVGRWIGDGWMRTTNITNYIGLAFNSDDKQGIEKISNYLKNLGFRCHYNASKTKKLVQLYVYGTMWPNLFKSLVPGYQNTSNTKHLPIGFRNYFNNILKALLRGLYDSDGSFESNHGGQGRDCIDTTSKQLMLEVREALLYLGLPSSVSVRKPYFRGEDKTQLCHESFKIRFRGFDSGVSKDNLIFFNGFYSKITEKKIRNDIKKVYDIEVDHDHSYLTSNFIVHNSVGGSLVAHLLDIHAVNPLDYGLIFERFHNKEKKAFPDIDTDFAPSGRDWVEKYVVNKYGIDKVAHVSNLSKMTPKVVIKDIARSLELGGGKSEAFKIANKVTDSISITAKTFDDALQSEEFVSFCAKYSDIEKYGRKLVGLEKTYATHAAGIVISDIDLSTYVPLRYDREGNISVQYEKERCEQVKLIKMDLLGLEHLDIIDETIKNAKTLGIVCPQPEELKLFDDKGVWDMICKGQTICVFQMGSLHMRALCKQIKPRNIEELSLVNALGRPSAVKSRMSYIARRDGREKVTYIHECLRPALQETLGVCVYEDQLMKLAKYVAGWDLNKADGLRKLTKLKEKGKELAAKLKDEFVADAIKFNKLSREVALDIWETIIEPFEGYGFNKAHGIFYSINGYHTAYYKYHYPAAFMAAVLKSEVAKASSNKEKIRIYKKEAERMGIKIITPDINNSGEFFTASDKSTIRMGIATITGVGTKAVQNIIETRNEHKFMSFADFLYRTNSSIVRKNVIQPMAKAGCFDSFIITRKSAHDFYNDIRVKGHKHAEKKAVTGADSWTIMEDFKINLEGFNDEWTKKDILNGELETLGEYVSGTIDDMYGGFFTGNGVSFKSLKKMADKTPVRVEAVVESISEARIQKVGKNKGNVYARCTLIDKNKDTVQMTIWANMWKKIKEKNIEGKPICALCRINVYKGTNTLILDNIEKIMES